MIINSDIVMVGEASRYQELFNQSQRGLIVFNREDYDTEMEHSKRYDYGMDGFIFHKSFYHIYPQGVYAMGQTWWDFWIPFTTLKNEVSIFQVPDKLLFHKTHPIQYNSHEWMKMVRYFQWENDYYPENQKRPQFINDSVLTKIQNGFRQTFGMI